MAPHDLNLDEPLMTEREFAALMRQGLLVVQRWRRNGDVPPHFKNGQKLVLYRRSDVARWLAARFVQPEGQQAA